MDYCISVLNDIHRHNVVSNFCAFFQADYGHCMDSMVAFDDLCVMFYELSIVL